MRGVSVALMAIVAVVAFNGQAVEADGKIVMCYFGSWSVYRSGVGRFDVEDIPPFLCTHIMFGFAGLDPVTNKVKVLDPYNELYDNWGKGAYDRFTALKNVNPNLKTFLAIGGWNEGSENYSNMAKDPAKRAIFVADALAITKRHNFDGFDLDWEYPANRGGIAEDMQNFNLLVGELRAVFEPEGLLLTAAVSAGFETIDTAYDIPYLSANLDLINVMTYDYHGWWEEHEFTAHNSPLYMMPGEETNETVYGKGFQLNSDFSMNYWIEGGADPSKLLMGVGVYGRGFRLVDPNDNGLYAPAIGPCEAGYYTGTPGFKGYNEFCELLHGADGNGQAYRDWTFVRQEQTVAPYAYNGDQWFSFDDVYSMSVKSQYILDNNLAGAMIWSIDTDDFQNLCGDGEFPLTTEINRILNGGGQTPPDGYTTPQPGTTPPPGPTNEPGLVCEAHAGLRPHPTDCHKFYQCVDDGAGGWDIIVSDCGNYAWNDDTQSCDNPENVAACDEEPTTMPPATTLDPGDIDLCPEGEGFYTNMLDCSRFHECVADGMGGYNVYYHQCGFDLVFNEEIDSCDYPENVPGCD